MVRSDLVAHLAQDCHNGSYDQKYNSDPQQKRCSLYCDSEDEQYDSNNDKC